MLVDGGFFYTELVLRPSFTRQAPQETIVPKKKNQRQQRAYPENQEREKGNFFWNSKSIFLRQGLIFF